MTLLVRRSGAVGYPRLQSNYCSELHVGQVILQTMGRTALRRAVRVASGAVALAVVSASIALVAVPRAHGGGVSAELTYSAHERQRICEEVLRKIRLWYSYFDEKGIDWELIGQPYLDRVASAGSDREFFDGMARAKRRSERSS